MKAFENAKRFFDACEAPEGWAGCKQYVAKDAPFTAQSEPLAEIKTVEAYCEWMAAFGRITCAGATYDLHTSSYDEETRTAVFFATVVLLTWSISLHSITAVVPAPRGAWTLVIPLRPMDRTPNG